MAELAALAPHSYRRMGANPHANGGLLLRDLICPISVTTRSRWTSRAPARPRAPGALGAWLRDVIKRNPATFRLFGPDETASNRLQDVFQATNRASTRRSCPPTITWLPTAG